MLCRLQCETGADVLLVANVDGHKVRIVLGGPMDVLGWPIIILLITESHFVCVHMVQAQIYNHSGGFGIQRLFIVAFWILI